MPVHPDGDQHAGAEHRADRRRERGKVPRGHDCDLGQHADEDRGCRDHDDERRECTVTRRRGAAPRVAHGRRGTRDQAAEHPAQQRARAPAEELVGEVAGEPDADDQRDHQPGLERVEDLVRPVAAIGQYRQDHERDQHELHDRGHVALADLRGERVQQFLVVQQHRDRAAERDRDCGLADHEVGADAVQQQCRDLGRLSGIHVAALRQHEIADDQQRRERDEAGRHDPAAVFDREPAAERAQGRDHREGADAADRGFRPLALEPDQQPEQQRSRELHEEIWRHARCSLGRLHS